MKIGFPIALNFIGVIENQLYDLWVHCKICFVDKKEHIQVFIPVYVLWKQISRKSVY